MVSTVRHVAIYFVMPDYLAIGTDDDFFRVPITPATATAIADQFDASLITAKVSDEVFAAAQVKLDPKPLTKHRDTVATFWHHHTGKSAYPVEHSRLTTGILDRVMHSLANDGLRLETPELAVNYPAVDWPFANHLSCRTHCRNLTPQLRFIRQ